MTTTSAASALQSLQYSKDDNGIPTLNVLDQLLIPHAKEYLPVETVEAAWSVIRKMQIRGAPLIAIVACLGLSVDLLSNSETIEKLNALDPNDASAITSFVEEKMEYLATARPTAVNVFNALKEVKEAMAKAAAAETEGGSARERICAAIRDHAEFMLQRDVADNQAIGKYGADLILKSTAGKPATMMTICNTGSLATAGYGTGLGVMRALHSQGKLAKMYALETRPYNQGARLTAFEMVQEQVPNGTLICDSAAAFCMAREGGVDAVVVGADRVCANGDTANKIGTYSLALVAAAHQVPFYVASPFTTLDTSLPSGDAIPIEERPAKELIETSRAPKDVKVWNPAFDVTPAKYIAGIITEKGVILPKVDGTIDVKAFVEQHESGTNGHVAAPEAESKLVVPFDYAEQTVDSLAAFLAKNAPLAMEKLGTDDPSEVECKEVGDGNLNLVFIVTNTKAPEKQIIVKQALPYVRCVGESWPLTLERSYFEYKALVAQKDACPEFVPSIYYFSKSNGLMVMEFIPPPNIILRKGFIAGIQYPTMASDMGMFCAKTLFKTSGFHLTETQLREQVEFWSTNREMCALTEQVVFTEPYIEAANNRWTSPQLDADKKAIENDVKLKVESSKLKHKFVTETQSLLHADLHSGSVMCSPADHQTFVIDPEFAFYGPMGFDTGAFLANMLLAYASQAGHKNGDAYADWILEQIKVFYSTFESEFLKLWDDEDSHTGMKFKRSVLGPSAVKASQVDYMMSLFHDTLGFAGMKMLRRIVGIAHVEDMESIEDADVRAKCERHALEIAKFFIKERASLKSIDDVIKLTKSKKESEAPTTDGEASTGGNKLIVPDEYTEQTVRTLPSYLALNAPDAMEQLGTKDASELDCKEVGDGNLNLVFIVTNTKATDKRIIVKQALPYVRCVGESWPLTLERSYFEYKALVAQKDACPEFVPSLYYFSRPNGLMVMEFIPPPNIILRKGFIAGIKYPTMASDMGTFCAKTLFMTSGFHLTETQLREQVEFWSTNREMCALTEQVVFTEPYIHSANNRWTSPQLDDEKKAIENDDKLKVESSKLKHKFVTETQSLLHADLHSGSVMCSPADHQTFVIDPEFAFYGPMGFDTGAFLANMLLAYASQAGHKNGDEYAIWILEQIKVFYSTFESEFLKLWDDEEAHKGMKFKRSVLGESAVKSSQEDYMAGLFQDTMGFAGMKMLRRIVGIAHVEDLDAIEDADVRAKCERHGLEMAKFFIKERSSLKSIDDVIELAKTKKA